MTEAAEMTDTTEDDVLEQDEGNSTAEDVEVLDGSPEAGDFLNMSDEDFLKQDPSAVGRAIKDEGFIDSPDDTLESKLNAPAQKPAEKPVEEQPAEESKDPAPASGSSGASGTSEATDGKDPSAAQDHTTSHQTDGAEKPKEFDFKAAYEQITAPFKANGQEFQVQSPEEAIKLMQMGANYTKKMQGLQPHLKMLRMLENKELLSNDKLNFLIDLHDRKPEAIQKLLHDGKIDPMDIDVSSEPAYKPNDHSVSDEEVAFRDTLDEVLSTQSGKDTVSYIQTNWDKTSKDAVYRDPKLLKVIQEQRENGIFAKISSELERQRTLGYLTDTPFIQAYKAVGDRLHAEGRLVNQPQSREPAQAGTPGLAPLAPAAPRVVDTRSQAPKKQMPNAERAKAAASAPSSAAPRPKPKFDPLNMTDDEIRAMAAPPKHI